MDRRRDLFDEHDLTTNELRAKRRAEFDEWLEQPKVRLCEAVMLSVGVVPQLHYRLRTPLPLSGAPCYPDEAYFGLMHRLHWFHSRMAQAVSAVRFGLLKGTPDPETASESDFRVSLAEFERWANKAEVSLPEEWCLPKQAPSGRKIGSQGRRQQNNLLRIIRALMRAAKVQDANSVWRLVESAPLVVPLERSSVDRAIYVLPLESKQQEDMSLDEKQSVLQTPSIDELTQIIAALLSANALIGLKVRGSAAKRIDLWVIEDHAALNRMGEVEPAIGTIRKILTKVRLALIDVAAAKAS